MQQIQVSQKLYKLLASLQVFVRKYLNVKCEGFKFSGHFPSNSKCDSIPYNLNYLLLLSYMGLLQIPKKILTLEHV